MKKVKKEVSQEDTLTQIKKYLEKLVIIQTIRASHETGHSFMTMEEIVEAGMETNKQTKEQK